MRALIGVELLRKLPAGPCDVRDTKPSGFVLRVRPSGAHAYFVNYARGKWQRVGTTATHTMVKAREEARQMLADVVRGADPVVERQARKGAITFETFIDQHYAPWATANRKTGDEQTASLRSTFRDLLDEPLSDISGFEVERWRSARLQAGRTRRPSIGSRRTTASSASRCSWKAQHLKERHPNTTAKT